MIDLSNLGRSHSISNDTEVAQLRIRGALASSDIQFRLHPSFVCYLENLKSLRLQSERLFVGYLQLELHVELLHAKLTLHLL